MSWIESMGRLLTGALLNLPGQCADNGGGMTTSDLHVALGDRCVAGRRDPTRRSERIAPATVVAVRRRCYGVYTPLCVRTGRSLRISSRLLPHLP